MRIVVKFPDNHHEQVCAIPFIYKLDELYPENEIHVLIRKEHHKILNLIPIELYPHVIEDDLKHPFDAHRIAAEIKVGEVDLFFSLNESLTDNSFGKWLRAKVSIGFGEGFKSMVLDYKISKPAHLHECDTYLKLIELIPSKEGDEERPFPVITFDRHIKSKELEPIIKDYKEDPYLVVNLPFDEEKDCFSYNWVEFFEYLKGQRIFFVSDQCSRTRFNILINDFILRLPEKNTYLSYSLNMPEFSSLVAHAQGFITPDSFLGHISSYVGAKTLIMYKEKADKKAPIYTTGDCFVLSQDEMLLTHGLKGKIVSEFEVGGILDIAHNFFDLTKIES